MSKRQKDRFDLENELMQCWSVVDDLKDTNIPREVIASYYQYKFERMWNTFEELVGSGNLE